MIKKCLWFLSIFILINMHISYASMNEFKRLVDGLDIVEECGIDAIRIGSHTYSVKVVKPYAGAFILSKYHNETAENWALKYTHRSPKHKMIYIALKDGSIYPASKFITNYLQGKGCNAN